MNQMESSNVNGFLSRALSLFLKNFSKKMNGLFVKKLADFIFSIGEKIIINLDKLLPMYIRYYEDIIDEEIKMAGICNSDKILHIGCGPVPSTSILINKKTGASVAGIDKNISATKGAKSCIKMINRNNKIQIQHANALDYKVQDFDVIMFSQGVEPRYKILESISKSMKTNTRLIFRTVSSADGELTNQDSIIKKLFKISKTISHENHGLLISVLLLKK